MADVQAPSSALPEYKSIERVREIPIVHDSLTYAHSVFSENPYTSYVYNTGLGIGNYAYSYSIPVQARLAPLITRADSVALKGIDVVESKFPYPFKTPTDELIGNLKSSSDQAYNAFYSRVQAPAYGIAQNADKSLSPIVDKLELAVNKLHSQSTAAPGEASSSTTAQTQVARAYKLSLELRDQLYLLSGEQIKQLQAHNALVQRATDTIYKLNNSLVSFGKETSAKVHAISNSILAELEKVQASASTLPNHVQSAVKPLQIQLSQTLTDLQAVIHSNGSASQKATQVASAVQNQIGPVLEAFKESATNLTGSARATAEPVSNGNGSSNETH